MAKLKEINTILCAVRGVPESRETASFAIQLAVEHDAHLTFFLVIDAEFIGQAGPTMTPLKIVYQQLSEMSEFAMMILSDRANRQGVSAVDFVIRRGGVGAEIRNIVKEKRPDVLVIGSPRSRPARSVFRGDEFDRLVNELEEIVQVQVVKPTSSR